MYWPMHVLRQQQFLPLLGHLHSHLMVKLWWWNCGAHADWFLLGVTWSLAKLPRAFESWVLVSVLLQETMRSFWKDFKKRFSVETCGIDMWAHFQNYWTPIVLKYSIDKNRTTPPRFSTCWSPQNISNASEFDSRKTRRNDACTQNGECITEGWWPKTTRYLVVAMGTPRKSNMEPKNTQLNKKSYLPNHHFQVPC